MWFVYLGTPSASCPVLSHYPDSLVLPSLMLWTRPVQIAGICT